MASTAQNNSFRVTGISHGAFDFPDPTGGSIDEEVSWSENRPAGRISPATVMDSYGCKAVAECSMRFTPIARGTKDDLTFTVLEYDGATSGTVTVADMLAGDYHADFNSKPAKHSQHFAYDAANTENLAPISFT